jgi:outer membrane receptor protein involved in Fe transport
MVRFTFTLITILAFCGAHISAATHQPLQAASISGTVRDQTGAPINGAEVLLYTPSSIIASMTTGVDGEFAFTEVRGREGKLVVRARGFAEVSQRWNVKETGTTRLEIALTPLLPTEQVTVTATRSATRVDETAASVNVLTSETLATTAAATIDDALRQLAGFQLFRRSGSRTANPTSQGVSLRGTGASGASRAVVLVDGIPLNDPFGGWVYWSRVPRASVERVEVLRGGASSLYGSAALGGVAQVFTRKTTARTLSLEASYGNERTPDASLFVSGSKGRWGAALAAETFRTDGYIIVAEQERGSVDTPAGSRHATLDLTLERRLNDAGRVFVRGAVFGESRTNGTPLQTNRTHIRQLSAGGDWESKSTGALSLRIYGGTEIFDQNFSAVSSDRNSETLTRVQRSPSQSIGFTSQWSRGLGDTHTLVAGLDGREVRGASDEIVFAQSRPTSLVGAGGRERTLGFFAEDIFRPVARLFLTGGVRVDRWRNYAALSASRSLRQNAPATINQFPVRTETAFSPQLSALYKVNERISFSASAYRAFRQPTLNELYRAFRVGDVLTLANENLRAERLTGGEAALSVAPLNGKFNMRGAFFWTEINRPIANVTLSVAPSLITRQRRNLGRTRSRGIEIESEARLGAHWMFSGGYLFADATVLKFPSNVALEGLLVPQVARHQLTFQMRYTNPARINFGLQARAAGAQFDDDQNRFRLKRYFTLDAISSRRMTRNLDLFIAAENLLNQHYETGRTPVTTVGPPLLVRVGLRLRLGSQ